MCPLPKQKQKLSEKIGQEDSRKTSLKVIPRQQNLRPMLPRRAYYPGEPISIHTNLVPSEIACLVKSSGRMSLTEVWISRDETS
jgi:hypothetical protein